MRTRTLALVFCFFSAPLFAQGPPRVQITDSTGTAVPVSTTTEVAHNAAIGTVTLAKFLLDGCRASSTAPSPVSASDYGVLGICNLLGARGVFPVANSWGGADTCYRASTVSTNAVNCKAQAATWYDIHATNVTSAIYYLTFYNTAGTPTCGTGIIEVVAIPHNSGNGGGIAFALPTGRNFSTGIGTCITSAADGTGNAAVGVYVSIGAK